MFAIDMDTCEDSSNEATTTIYWKNQDREQKQNGPSNGGSSAQAKRLPKIQGGLESYVINLKSEGASLISDEQPSFDETPDWLDVAQIELAKKLYQRHFMAMNFAHLSGLLLLVRVDSIHQTLALTGQSDSVAKLFKRYYDTLCHVKCWYEGDFLDPKDPARQSLQTVRGMHNKVSQTLNSSHEHKWPGATGCPLADINGNLPMGITHISQYDIMITQFAFIGLIVLHPNQMGLLSDFERSDLQALVDFWRLIGFYLGVGDKYNLCSYQLDDVIAICRAMSGLVYRHSLNQRSISSQPGIMSVNVARAVKFIPMLTFYGIMRHAYRVLGHDTHELEARRSYYSALSYSLMDLVMCRLLRYRFLRSFNNGLIRLSIFVVGRVRNWYCKYLVWSHGAQLSL